MHKYACVLLNEKARIIYYPADLDLSWIRSRSGSWSCIGLLLKSTSRFYEFPLKVSVLFSYSKNAFISRLRVGYEEMIMMIFTHEQSSNMKKRKSWRRMFKRKIHIDLLHLVVKRWVNNLALFVIQTEKEWNWRQWPNSLPFRCDLVFPFRTLRAAKRFQNWNQKPCEAFWAC